jgi:transposase-like protein
MHRLQIHSTNPLDQLNTEIKPRTNLNEAAIMRLVGALLLEQNDEWALRRDEPSTQPGLTHDSYATARGTIIRSNSKQEISALW